VTRIQFHYKNHRGQVELRIIELLSLDYVPMPHHEYGYGPGWFLHGKDYTVRDGVERMGEPRSFALSNIQMTDYYAPPQGQIGTAFRIPMKGESIANFVAWLTTQPKEIKVGASNPVYDIFDAHKAYGERFAHFSNVKRVE
jgi:hypothetical protein